MFCQKQILLLEEIKSINNLLKPRNLLTEALILLYYDNYCIIALTK